MEVFYAKRLVRGAVDGKQRPIPDCVRVSAFLTENNRDRYVEAHKTTKPAEADEPLVVRARLVGLRDDYHTIAMPISVLKELAGEATRQEEADEPEDVPEDKPVIEPIEPEPVKAEDETKELVPFKPKKKKRKRGRPKKKS